MPSSPSAVKPIADVPVERAGSWGSWKPYGAASSAPPNAAANPSGPVEAGENEVIRSLSLNFPNFPHVALIADGRRDMQSLLQRRLFNL